MNLTEYIAANKLKLTAHEVPTRPDNFMGDSAYHFRCRISKDSRGFGFYWSQGSGVGPEMSNFEDVLDALASDAAGYENAKSFEGWASEYGYDVDSRSAEKTYRVIKRQVESLKRLLGEAAYNELIWDVNR